MWLEVHAISKNYADKQVLKSLSFGLKTGEIACFLGSSGSGKSTALRAIAGFERLHSGRICLGGDTVSSTNVFVPPHQRQIGMVFQDHALFPHLSVAENIAFGLSAWTASDRLSRVTQLLQLVHLTDFARSFPHELSGGQQQRVALARSLAPKPKLLLLDEPFSSLDVELRERLAREVRHILKTEGVTALMVTHDQQEAFAIADKIGVIHNGAIEQWDVPYSLYHEPKTRYVADFIGQGVFIKGVVQSKDCIALELGNYCGQLPDACQIGDELDVLIRPDDIIHDDNAPQQYVVLDKVFRGTDFIYTLGLPSGQHVLAQVPSHHRHDIGEAIGVYLDLDHLIAFGRP